MTKSGEKPLLPSERNREFRTRSISIISPVAIASYGWLGILVTPTNAWVIDQTILPPPLVGFGMMVIGFAIASFLDFHSQGKREELEFSAKFRILLSMIGCWVLSGYQVVEAFAGIRMGVITVLLGAAIVLASVLGPVFAKIGEPDAEGQ